MYWMKFESISKSYGELFVEDTNMVHLDKAIAYIKTSISMAPNVARTYAHLTALYVYFLQKGWEEPKIVMRACLLGVVFALLGLYIAFLR